jgi:AcrR family transcriptional regulator
MAFPSAPSKSKTGEPCCHASACRDWLLDAAEEVVLKRGIGALTLEAVAAEAKVSKGGLLHYFPSKDKLIEALVVRTTNQWRDKYTRAIESLPPGPGRVSRALMSMCLSQDGECAAGKASGTGREEQWNTSMRRSGVVLIAAMASNPKLVQPMRDVYSQLFAMLQKDGLTPGVAEVVALAIDGLWFEWLFGLWDRTPQRMKAIRGALRATVDLASSDDTGAERSGKARAGRGAGKIGRSSSLGTSSTGAKKRAADGPASKAASKQRISTTSRRRDAARRPARST